jgi:hypothetical protein
MYIVLIPPVYKHTIPKKETGRNKVGRPGEKGEGKRARDWCEGNHGNFGDRCTSNKIHN